MITLASPLFNYGEKLPKNYTCDGKNVSPPLVFGSVPPKAKSLALIMEDKDAIFGMHNHWLLWNIPPETSRIEENAVPAGATVGINSYNENNYTGPCPRITKDHRYIFTLFALDTTVSLGRSARRRELEEYITNHIIDEGRLMAVYSR